MAPHGENSEIRLHSTKTFFLLFFILSLYSLKTLFCVALFCFLAKKKVGFENWKTSILLKMNKNWSVVVHVSMKLLKHFIFYKQFMMTSRTTTSLTEKLLVKFVLKNTYLIYEKVGCVVVFVSLDYITSDKKVNGINLK